MQLSDIVSLADYPIEAAHFRQLCKQQLDSVGALVMPGFLTPAAIAAVAEEGRAKQSQAYYTQDQHNIYLKEPDPALPAQHPRNRRVKSSKGCITDDQIDRDSPLRTLYDAGLFRSFLADVLGEDQLYPYADPLSSINLHYAADGQELGWHFDNSSFAITLLIQKPEQGGRFEYVEAMRDADGGEMNYEGVQQVLDGELRPKALDIQAGSLVMFRGRNAIHRVTPAWGDLTRMLVVLAYNAQPDISLSESARMTFYGRL